MGFRVCAPYVTSRTYLRRGYNRERWYFTSRRRTRRSANATRWPRASASELANFSAGNAWRFAYLRGGMRGPASRKGARATPAPTPSRRVISSLPMRSGDPRPGVHYMGSHLPRRSSPGPSPMGNLSAPDIDRYATHCARRGYAATIAESGETLVGILRAGGWSPGIIHIFPDSRQCEEVSTQRVFNSSADPPLPPSRTADIRRA